MSRREIATYPIDLAKAGIPNSVFSVTPYYLRSDEDTLPLVPLATTGTPPNPWGVGFSKPTPAFPFTYAFLRLGMGDGSFKHTQAWCVETYVPEVTVDSLQLELKETPDPTDVQAIGGYYYTLRQLFERILGNLRWLFLNKVSRSGDNMTGKLEMRSTQIEFTGTQGTMQFTGTANDRAPGTIQWKAPNQTGTEASVYTNNADNSRLNITGRSGITLSVSGGDVRVPAITATSDGSVAATKKYVDDIRDNLQNQINNINNEINNIKNDITSIKNDITSIKNDITTIKNQATDDRLKSNAVVMMATNDNPTTTGTWTTDMTMSIGGAVSKTYYLKKKA